jgi:transcriptional regulator GlxA family with amidase domain
VLVLDENQREAAQRLGLSHDAARKRFQRALGRLREHLASSLSHSDLAGRVCLPTNRMNRPEEPTA